jgi:hypothetical protein
VDSEGYAALRVGGVRVRVHGLVSEKGNSLLVLMASGSIDALGKL